MLITLPKTDRLKNVQYDYIVKDSVEHWQPLKSNHPKLILVTGYWVSTKGRILSYHIDKDKGRYLSTNASSNGYVYVKIHGVSEAVHLLVWDTFCGGREDTNFKCINHIDGNKSNNSLINLEYVTKQEGAFHSARVLGNSRGEHHGNAKLKNAHVRNILRAKGIVKARVLSDTYGVSRSQIYRIWNGKAWNHLTQKYANNSHTRTN